MDDLTNEPATPSTLDEALRIAQQAREMNLRYSPMHRALNMLAAEVPALRDEIEQLQLRAEAAEAELEAYRRAERNERKVS
jgi:hypothetical protein